MVPGLAALRSTSATFISEAVQCGLFDRNDRAGLPCRPALLQCKLRAMAADEDKAASEKTEKPAAEPTHSPDGVDLTLIRWMLSLTPRERIEVLQNNVRAILRLRGEQSGT
ncbi:MAG: hypothetical protein ACE145_19590 [Terriglobia bacterium]